MSLTRVDLPEPDTPVTATKQPERELDREVLEVVLAGALARRAARRRAAAASSGTGIDRLPERYWPVIDALFFSSAFTVPAWTTSPPCSPAPGPMSTT